MRYTLYTIYCAITTAIIAPVSVHYIDNTYVLFGSLTGYFLANFFSLIMLRYKQQTVYYFLHVATGFALFWSLYQLHIELLDTTATALIAIILQSIIYIAGNFVDNYYTN